LRKIDRCGPGVYTIERGDVGGGKKKLGEFRALGGKRDRKVNREGFWKESHRATKKKS